MGTWVALLRGINVGGANQLATSDLRVLATSLGHLDVTTYIQSGNVIWRSPRTDPTVMAEELTSAIERAHGLSVVVVLRTPEELRSALALNPYAEEPDRARVTITFLAEMPNEESVAGLDRGRFVPDRFDVRGAEIYCHYPNGAGRSKLTLDYFEKKIGVRGTARNLNTVHKLIDRSEM